MKIGENFPKSGEFPGENFPGFFPGTKNPRKFPEISGKKVSKMTVFGKFNTRLRSELFRSNL